MIEGKEVMVIGDLNIDFHKKCWKGEILRGIYNKHKLSQMIVSDTRVTSTSSSLIDHVVTSSPGAFLDSGCVDVGVSDYLMVFTNMQE